MTEHNEATKEEALLHLRQAIEEALRVLEADGHKFESLQGKCSGCSAAIVLRRALR